MRATKIAFRDFMKQRDEVAKAFVNGDPAPLVAISTKYSPATIFGPGGGTVAGAKKVISKNEGDSMRFAAGSTSFLKVIHSGADGYFAYWVGLQNAKVNIRGKRAAVPMRLRVTEIFRREGDGWKLMHRHADMLAQEKKGKR